MPADITLALPVVVLAVSVLLVMILVPWADPALTRMTAVLGLATACAETLLHLHADPIVGNLLVDDGMSRVGAALVCLTGLGAVAFLRPGPAGREAPALVLLATLGAALLCGAVHAATLFLSLELVTLSLIAMFVLPLTPAALEAGYKLLILGGIGAAVFLFALALAYAATGQLSLEAWSARGMLLNLATALLMAGIAFKFALVPFHMWTPDAFAGAPAAAAAFAGTGSKIGIAIVLLRLEAVGPPEPLWSSGLAMLAGASIVLGNLQAMRQTSLRRLLGYSSIAHSGYVAAIVSSGSVLAPEAVLFYLTAYGLSLIAALCSAMQVGDDCSLDDLNGLIWNRPLLGVAFALSILSLAGLPVTIGFLGKFYLFSALVQAGAWKLLLIAALGSALGFYYYGRTFIVAFRQGNAGPHGRPGWNDAVVLISCTAGSLAVGLYPMPLAAMLRQALD